MKCLKIENIRIRLFSKDLCDKMKVYNYLFVYKADAIRNAKKSFSIIYLPIKFLEYDLNIEYVCYEENAL